MQVAVTNCIVTVGQKEKHSLEGKRRKKNVINDLLLYQIKRKTLSIYLSIYLFIHNFAKVVLEKNLTTTPENLIMRKKETASRGFLNYSKLVSQKLPMSVPNLEN